GSTGFSANFKVAISAGILTASSVSGVWLGAVSKICRLFNGCCVALGEVILRSVLDYATKLIVILSVAGAVVLEAFLAARAWPNLLPLTIASFVVAAGATFFVGELSTAVVLFLTYLMPAVFLVTRGDASVFFGTIWL